MAINFSTIGQNIQRNLGTLNNNGMGMAMGSAILGNLAQGQKDKAANRMNIRNNQLTANQNLASNQQDTSQSLYNQFANSRSQFGQSAVDNASKPAEFLNSQAQASQNALRAAIMPQLTQMMAQMFNPTTAMGTLKNPSNNLFKGIDYNQLISGMMPILTDRSNQVASMYDMVASPDVRSDYLTRFNEGTSLLNPLGTSINAKAYGLGDDLQTTLSAAQALANTQFANAENSYSGGMNQGLNTLTNSTNTYNKQLDEEYKKNKSGGFGNILGNILGIAAGFAPMMFGLPPVPTGVGGPI